MKKNSVIYIAIAVVVFSFVTTGYAQVGDLINRTKDTIKKKKDKKEQPENQPPSTIQPTRSETPDNNSDNAQSKNKQMPVKSSELGNIYFSNQPFINGTEGSKTSFNSNEFIYGRLVLNGGTVREVLKPASLTKKIKGYQIPFKIYWKDSNGQKHYPDFLADNAVLSEADLDKTYWDFDFFPPPDKAKTVVFTDRNFNDGYESSDSVYLFLNNEETKEGTYRLGVEIKNVAVDFRGNPLPASETQTVEGEIPFTFRGADYANIKANYNALTKTFAATARQSQTANQELPKEWTEATNRILPIATEAQMRLMFLNRFRNKASLQIIKFHASAPGQTSWSVEKNNLGIPIYRYSNQTYTIFVKNTAENQCFFDNFGLRQNYSGGGTYGQTFLDFDEKSQRPFNCNKVNAK